MTTAPLRAGGAEGGANVEEEEGAAPLSDEDAVEDLDLTPEETRRGEDGSPSRRERPEEGRRRGGGRRRKKKRKRKKRRGRRKKKRRREKEGEKRWGWNRNEDESNERDNVLGTWGKERNQWIKGTRQT